jgi:hypothetical protein
MPSGLVPSPAHPNPGPGPSRRQRCGPAVPAQGDTAAQDHTTAMLVTDSACPPSLYALPPQRRVSGRGICHPSGHRPSRGAAADREGQAGQALAAGHGAWRGAGGVGDTGVWDASWSVTEGNPTSCLTALLRARVRAGGAQERRTSSPARACACRPTQIAPESVAARLNVGRGALVQAVAVGGVAERAGLLPTRRGLGGVIPGAPGRACRVHARATTCPDSAVGVGHVVAVLAEPSRASPRAKDTERKRVGPRAAGLLPAVFDPVASHCVTPGDVIIALDGRPVGSGGEFLAQLDGRQVRCCADFMPVRAVVLYGLCGRKVGGDGLQVGAGRNPPSLPAQARPTAKDPGSSDVGWCEGSKWVGVAVPRLRVGLLRKTA